MPMPRSTGWLIVIVFGGVALGGLGLPAWMISVGLSAMSQGIVVLGLVVLMRAGLISFGQGLYFGLGGYAVGVLSLEFGITDAFLRVIAAALAAAAVGLLLGCLLRRYRGIFFAMLSLAFSMIFYGLLVKNQNLGSTDGFRVLASTFAGRPPTGGANQLWLFLFACLLSAVCALAVHRYFRSTLGWLATAIRDNETRVEYLGCSVNAAVHLKLVLCSALAGIGGALSAMTVGHIDPAITYWTTSGELVFVAILGGAGSVFAPFLGALVFQVVHTLALAMLPHAWHVILGGVLLASILFMPDGLWSAIARRRERSHG